MSLRFLSTWVLIWYASVCAKVPTYVLLMSCSTWDMSPLVTRYILRVLVEMCPQVSRYVQLSCARVKYICQWILFLVQLSWPRPHLVRKISHCLQQRGRPSHLVEGVRHHRPTIVPWFSCTVPRTWWGLLTVSTLCFVIWESNLHWWYDTICKDGILCIN